MIGILLGGGAIVTLAYMAIIRTCARVMIWFTLALSVIGFAVGALAFFAAGACQLGLLSRSLSFSLSPLSYSVFGHFCQS